METFMSENIARKSRIAIYVHNFHVFLDLFPQCKQFARKCAYSSKNKKYNSCALKISKNTWNMHKHGLVFQ